MKTSATNRRVRVLMTAIREKKLLPRPEFQRRLVWTNRHKENFLQTVLLKYPFPEIYVAAGEVDPETGEGTEMLVDGQQRLTTLYQYFTGSSDLLLKEVRPYSQLERGEKLEFLEYEVVIRDLGQKSIDEIKEVFKRINSTKYSLNAMEIHNARFDGALKTFAEMLAQNNFFEDNHVFGTNDVRRMGDVVFCLTLVISVLGNYFNRDDLLEKFLKQYNDELPQTDELASNFQQIFKLVNDCGFGAKSRVWRKADLLTLLVELYHAKFTHRLDIDAAKLGVNLRDFYSVVDGIRDNQSSDKKAADYYKAALQATNDRGNRVRRGEIVAEIIKKSTALAAA